MATTRLEVARLTGGWRAVPWRLRLAGAATKLARLGVGLLGTGILAAGAVAVFVTTNSAGTAALVVAGAVLVVVALFANQLESLEGGGFKLQLAAEKLREAHAADAAGDAEGAEQLRQEAEVLLAAAEPIAVQYEALRENSPSGRTRTRAMGALLDQARTMAHLDFVTRGAVAELFRAGQDGNRITALGMMRANPELVSLPLVIEAIRQPRSSYEQWQALSICWNLVQQEDQQAQYDPIREAISVARANGTLGNRRDQSRVNLAEQITAAMANQAGSP